MLLYPPQPRACIGLSPTRLLTIRHALAGVIVSTNPRFPIPVKLISSYQDLLTCYKGFCLSRHYVREVAVEQVVKFDLMRMDRLTAPLLRELIDHINVFETEGNGKNRTQRIVIYYRLVGYVEIPEVSHRTNIVADTRKGVAVEYLTEPKTA